MVKRRMGIMVFLICLFLCFMPCIAGAVSTAEAKERIDPNRESSVTLSYRSNGTAVSGQKVKLYRIAEVSADAEYTLEPSFAASGLTLNGIQTNDEWKVVRSTLEAFILANDISPMKADVTDQRGKVCFTGLKPGLYLIPAVKTAHGDSICSFDSALVALPGLQADGLWQYHVSTASKSETSSPNDPSKDIQFKVLKLWKGDQGDADRPSSVEVEIFRNGVSFETVVLSEDTNWSYHWTTKDDGASWKVIERNIPEDYVMTIEERGTAFVLTNAMIPDVPVISIEEPSEIAGVSDMPEGSKILSGEHPQTGDTSNVLFYAVLMLVSGSMLIILGVTGKRSRYEEKE